ncbi:MAG: hypothetical protein K8S15_13795 [Candidatus Aegiribacteria sp.]|nr:hypothetical protein [Candidatus Aegiribacteria sp.]
MHLVLLINVCIAMGSTNDTISLANRMQDSLPDGWECTIVDQDGHKGHPQGLDEPLFRVDFINPDVLFDADRRIGLNPTIQLYFYDINSKPDVMKVIGEQSLYSWDIPIYFGETEEYIVVTSPAYVNHGVFTEEAKNTIRPIWNALRIHIECKEDELIEQLVQPVNE